MKTTIPPSIVTAVSGLLQPFNLDFESIIKQSEKDNPSNRGCEKIYYKIPEAEIISGLTRWTIVRYGKAGKFKMIKLSKSRSGKVLIECKSFLAFLDSCCVLPSSPKKEQEDD